MKMLKEFKIEEKQKLLKSVESSKILIRKLKEEYGRDYLYTMEYQDIPTVYKKLFYTTENLLATEIEKLVENHFNKLQLKVEKKIGKILEIDHIEGNDYFFKGEKDSCKIEVIYAGGYNIQVAHTRWIIKN